MIRDDNFSSPPDSESDPHQTSSAREPAANPQFTNMDPPPSTGNLIFATHAPPFAAVAERRMSDPSVPQDLRVPWSWLSLLLFVIATVASIFGLYVVGMIFYTAAGGTIDSFQDSTRVQGLFGVILQYFVDFGWLAFFAVMLRVVYRQPFWHTIGWRPLETTRFSKGAAYLGLVVAGLFIGFVVVFASNLVPPKGELPVEQLLQDRTTAMLFALMSVAVAPLTEETLFRGFLYPLIARSFGVGTSILFTGIIFGLLHAPQLSGAWFQIGLLAAVGILFTLARAVTKSVVSSFLLHVSYNSLQVIGMIIDTHGFRQMHNLH